MPWHAVSPITSGSATSITDHHSVAYCELYVAVAAVALRVLPSLELCNTVDSGAVQSGLTANRKFKGNMVRVRDS